MALRTCKNLLRLYEGAKCSIGIGKILKRNPSNLSSMMCLQNRHNSGTPISFDPPYLEAMKPKIPIYDAINVQIKGYDFALVEAFQSLVHNIANLMELEVEECWATPATATKVNRFKPGSGVVEAEYNLTLYERNVQIVDLPSTTAIILMDLIQSTIPQGLTVSLHPHADEHEEIRFVPDYELVDLKSQLDSILQSRKK